MNFLPEKRNGRDVLVGMRPEHLEIAANGAAGTLPAEVVVVEPTGADTHIFCKVGGVDVTAVVRERHDFHPGEALRLRPKLTYVFDPSSGARLA
jgi:multiple sugar transport system ATP-binding protein